jgi:hypothetical protein
MSSTAYAVPENAGFVAVTVLKSPNTLGGAVNFTTANGSAVAYTEGFGDYQGSSGSLVFTPSQTSQTITVPIIDDPSYEGNQQFAFILTDVVGGNGSLGSPSSAVITIIEDDPPGSTNSFVEKVNPGSMPLHDGQLRVILQPLQVPEPAEFDGRWRLAWESGWHNSGATLNGLSSGNYEVECKPVSGFLLPSNTIVPIRIEVPSTVTIPYQPNGSPGVGALAVILQPALVADNPVEVARGQWRLEGETLWHDSAFVVTNLIAGQQIVEFKSVPDWITPAARQVSVESNRTSVIAATYLVANPPIGSSPTLVIFSNLQSPASEVTYAYNGQLVSQLGYGSGCVVKRRVVLTAAHVVFDDTTLSFVPEVRWMFQRNASNPGAPDPYEPPAQRARGWYVFGGYGAARRDDNSPGFSSPISQNLDVAALYFLENAGRGGQSGYLVSEPGGTNWLQASADKTLIGYPVEAVSEINRGRMHATLPANLNFTRVIDRVFITTDIHGYPGMSGGPLCVKYTNGIFYPAGIYLGGSAQATVRAIDSAVADLINRAEISSYTGDNSTGGGVIRISPFAGAGACGGSLTVFIEPKSARDAGAKFQVISTDPVHQVLAGQDLLSLRTIPLGKESFAIQFRTNVPGYFAPDYIAIQLNCSINSGVTGFYTVFPPTLTFLNKTNLAIMGTTGTTYRIEFVDQLQAANSWLPFSTSVLTNGWNSVPGATLQRSTNRIYRARWLP